MDLEEASILELSTPELCSQASSTEEIHPIALLAQEGHGTPTLVSNLPRVQSSSLPDGGAAIADTDLPRAFRVMLNQLARRLDDENVSSILFIHQLPSHENKNALTALRCLHQHGLFSWNSTAPLRKLLQDIGRYDLANTVLQEYETMCKQQQMARAVMRLSQQTPPPPDRSAMLSKQTPPPEELSRSPLVHQPYSDSVLAKTPPISHAASHKQRRQHSLPASTPRCSSSPSSSGSPSHFMIGGDEEECEMLGTQSIEEMTPKSSYQQTEEPVTILDSGTEPQIGDDELESEWEMIGAEGLEEGEKGSDKGRSSSLVSEETSAMAAKGQPPIVTQSMPITQGRRLVCCRNTREPGTRTKWSLQVKDLLPSLQQQRRGRTSRACMKLPKKTIEIKTSNMPKHKLAFTVHPHGSGPDSTGFLSLEVTVITKYASPWTPTLILSIVVKDSRDRELERHSQEQQLQSFFLHKFLSHAQLQQMSPSAKVVMEIHAQIVPTVHPEDYVVFETGPSIYQHQEMSKMEWEPQEQKIVQVASKEKEQQLQSELSAVWHVSRAEDQQIPILEQELRKETTLHTQSVEDRAVQADYLAIAPGSLRGVEVCGETVLEVIGNKSQKLEWPGYGFSLEVPDGALLPSVTSSVAIKAILAGQFQLPEDSQLISAIYWISAGKVFQKEVAVNIHHCAVIRSEEESSKFRFIIAKCSQKELPYRFRVQEGVFNPHTHYATIKLKQFSMVGATAPEGTELCYATLQFYKQIPNTPNVDFLFAVVHDHQPALKSVRQRHQKWKLDEGQSRTIRFDSDTITLNLSDSVVDHWNIVPMTPPQITKEEVDRFKPDLTIPSCLVWLVWTGEQVPPRLLCHKVTLKGTKSPTYFHIRHDPQVVGADVAAAESNPAPPTPQSRLGQTVDLSTLTGFKYKDEQGVEQRIYIIDEMAPRWIQVGTKLNFSESDIDNIDSTCHGDAVKCCRSLLSRWLQGHNNSNNSRPKTWETLLEVMRDARLGELADKLESFTQRQSVY